MILDEKELFDKYQEKIYNKLNNFQILNIIGDIGDKNNVQLFAIGGFVRDLLLDRENYDIDILCLQDSFFIANKVAETIKAHDFAIYKNFGTAMVKKDNLQIEFVVARKESYKFDSRKPEIQQGTFQDDQLRRDFTINTLAISLNKNDFGKLINTVHGLEDLNNKIIKTPVNPEVTFSDDPLRMLRCIRFATQLNFNIDINTFQVIINKKDRINIISKERIRDELNKIIMSKKPSIGFNLLSKCGLLKIIMPYIEDLRGKIQVDNFSHKDIYYHTLQVLDNVAEQSDNIWLRWTALFHDIAKPKCKKFDNIHGFSFHGHEELGARMIKNIFSDLHLSKDHIKYVEKLIRLHLRPITIAQDDVSDSGIRRLAFESGEDFNDLMILCRSDITSHNPLKIKEYLNNFDKVEDKIKYIIEKDYKTNLQPVITGEIIMNELNIKPGPIIGIIKNKLKEAILNGDVENKYEPLYNLMIKIIKENNII